MNVKKYQIRYDKTTNNTAINIPVRLDFIPVDNSELIEDKFVSDEIEKAIINSDLGLTPHNEGNLIRLQLPEMSASRREELLKVLSKKLEECKVSIRNTRKDFHNFIRDAKKDKSISENFFNRLSDTLQKITDTFIEKADKMSKKKVEELTTI